MAVKRSRSSFSSGFSPRKKFAINRRASKVSLKSVVKRQIAALAEVKELDSWSPLVNQSGGNALCVNQVPEGTDYNQRVGRHISSKYFYVDYYVNPPAGAAGTAVSDTGLISLVWDRQSDAVGVSYSTIFDTTSASPGQALKLNAQYKDRFTILWTEMFVVQSLQAGALSGSGNFIDVRKRKFTKLTGGKEKCEFGASGAAVPTTGALYLCFGTENNTIGTGSASVNYNYRYAYSDI